MPARLSSMELSSPSNPEVDSSARPSRRKSGRATKQTEFLSPAGSAKRKRNQDAVDPTDADSDAESDDAPEEDENDNDPDEEELRERRRKQKSKAANKPKPTAKKQKINGVSAGASATLVSRPAKKATKGKKAPRPSAAQAGGLYGMYAADKFGQTCALLIYEKAASLAATTHWTASPLIGLDGSMHTKPTP